VKKSYAQVHGMAAIFDAILNFSKCSRVTKVYPADAENGLPGLPKSIKNKLNEPFPGSVKISHLSAGLGGTLFSIWAANTRCHQIYYIKLSFYVVNVVYLVSSPSSQRQYYALSIGTKVDDLG